MIRRGPGYHQHLSLHEALHWITALEEATKFAIGVEVWLSYAESRAPLSGGKHSNRETLIILVALTVF
jgi:hypothetical protein